MSTEEYYDKTPYVKDLEENWGPAPGNLNSDGQNLVVYGKQFGNVFIGVQQSFEYPYFVKIFQADAVLHFGTYGSLEFMPGMQVGMSGTCYPDRLINSLPATLSYLTPPPENAGLYKGLKQLKELPL